MKPLPQWHCPRWHCPRCRAVHHYLPAKCQKCGKVGPQCDDAAVKETPPESNEAIKTTAQRTLFV